MLNRHKLIEDVFAPTADDVVLFMVDEPHDRVPDHRDWQERREMAQEWHESFNAFPVRLLPTYHYAATGANNGDLPQTGQLGEQEQRLDALLDEVTIIIAMTQYSATAPLSRLIRPYAPLRVASMPGVLRRMEETALAADYREVARRTHMFAQDLTDAEAAEVIFSTGERLFMDLRYRTGHADDGQCHRDKAFPLINLPSGEAFIVPYEGEREGEPSRTEGVIPLLEDDELYHLIVKQNRIVEVRGDGPGAKAFAKYLEDDPARANIAELGLGCNDRAVVQGAVIEDEKAGFHWAYGRSEHLGGTVGPDAFKKPENVVHQDIVYAPASPIGIQRLTLHLPGDEEVNVILDNEYFFE